MFSPCRPSKFRDSVISETGRPDQRGSDQFDLKNELKMTEISGVEQ
jgi:hypothetical protein